MKKHCLIFVFLIISLFVLSCKEEKSFDKSLSNRIKSLSIDLDDERLRTDEPAFLDFDFVKLETIDESLLGKVLKVAISDSIFFILSELGGDVMAFDKSGKYLFKLFKGRARNELTFPTDIAFSEQTGQLFVYDLYRILKIYDKNGVFIKSIHSNNVSLYLETIGDKFVFFDSDLDKEKDFYGEIREGKKVTKTFFSKEPQNLDKSKKHVFFHPFFKASEDSVFIYSMYSDTVYSVTHRGDSIKPYYVLDYHGRSMNQSRTFDRMSRLDRYRELCKEEKMGSGIRCFGKHGEQLFFMISERETYYVRYDLLSNKVVLHRNLMSGLPNSYLKVGGNSKYIIYSMTSSRLYNYFEENPVQLSDASAAKKLRNTVDEEDNPILILYNLNSTKENNVE